MKLVFCFFSSLSVIFAPLSLRKLASCCARRVRATEGKDLDYEGKNEDEEEPIEPVRPCTYSKPNKACFIEESP